MTNNIFIHGDVSHLPTNHPSFVMTCLMWGEQQCGPTPTLLAQRTRCSRNYYSLDWVGHRCHEAGLAYLACLRAALKQMGH